MDEVRLINITIEIEEYDEMPHICDCGIHEKDTSGNDIPGPLCPGAPRPNLEPIVEPTVDPTMEPTLAPVAPKLVPKIKIINGKIQKVFEPEEPVPEPIVEPAPEPAPEPIVELAPEPVIEPIVELAPEPVAEPIVELAPEPVIEPIVEPVPEPVIEPIVELIVEPAPEPIVELAPEPVIELIVEPAPEPIVESPIEGGFVREPSVPLPLIVFIVPYREREQQKQFFKSHMALIMEDYKPTDYAIYFIHQNDTRGFNRGAMKNIGFLAMKAQYPNDYKNITFVFNDVDTMPFTKNFLDYNTVPGVVKHFYGYTYALGGIFSIKGADFERVNGFPNFWTWGYEDNLLNTRVLKANLSIDRSQFYPIMDKNMFQMKDGITRIVNRNEFDRFMQNTDEGFSSIHTLKYDIDEPSNTVIVNQFFTAIEETPDKNIVYDLRKGNRPFVPIMQPTGRRGRSRMGMHL